MKKEPCLRKAPENLNLNNLDGILESISYTGHEAATLHGVIIIV